MTDAMRPPNLRDAPLDQLMQDTSCGGCQHFSGGKCRLYGDWPVDPAQLCETYEPRRPE